MRARKRETSHAGMLSDHLFFFFVLIFPIMAEWHVVQQMSRMVKLISLQTAVNELFIIYLCDFCERADESEDISEKNASQTPLIGMKLNVFFKKKHLISFDPYPLQKIRNTATVASDICLWTIIWSFWFYVLTVTIWFFEPGVKDCYDYLVEWWFLSYMQIQTCL